MEFSAKQIAEYIQGIIVGDENATVHTFAKIEEGVPGALSFLSNPKYTHYIYDTKSSIVLVNKDFEPEHELQTTLIKVDNAYESLAKLMALYEMSIPKKQGVSPLASIAESAKIGKNVYIGPFACIEDGAEIGDNVCIHPQATIGSNVKIGMNTIIYPHVTIYQDCRIGNNCILHAGAVIGADGFGFAPGADGYEKIPQIGIVELEDNVEIGANTCIARATMGHTLIKQGVKLDYLIQVAHYVEIGKHCEGITSRNCRFCQNWRMVYVRRPSGSCRTHQGRRPCQCRSTVWYSRKYKIKHYINGLSSNRPETVRTFCSYL